MSAQPQPNQSSKFISNTDLMQVTCIINPLRLARISLPSSPNPLLHENLDLPADLLTDLVACTDEMLHNAFIHGTLGLTPEERKLDGQPFQELVRQKLSQPQIAARRIRYELVIDNVAGFVRVSVEDDGDGFDHAGWMQDLQQEKHPTLDYNGRGLSMLAYLSDRLEFTQGGRRVQITFSMNNGGQTE